MKEHFSQANILDEMTEIVLRMEDVFEAEFGEVGLSLAEGQTLYGLVRTGAGSQKQLADRLRIEPPTFARLIRRLESRGLVWRFEADGDRRAKQLLLTAEGRDLVATIKRKTAGNLAKLVSGVIVSELETAQAVIGCIATNVGKLSRNRSKKTLPRTDAAPRQDRWQ